MDLASFESPDGVWRVESILFDGEHRYRISRDGEIYAELTSLTAVHRVLLETAAVDPAGLGMDHLGVTRPGPNSGTADATCEAH